MHVTTSFSVVRLSSLLTPSFLCVHVAGALDGWLPTRRATIGVGYYPRERVAFFTRQGKVIELRDVAPAARGMSILTRHILSSVG
jgi:hypothetical protein